MDKQTDDTVLDEVLLLDKPLGWSSFDVVAKVRRNYSQRFGRRVKVGHAGTLDPLATGLLIVLVGKATKRQDQFMKLDKVYDVEICLGQTSSTDDNEGEKKKVSDKQPEMAEISAVLKHFTGLQQQTPPAFSAIKVNGQRAYKLARAGKPVEVKPRYVTVHWIKDVSYSYPKISFSVKVSSGTYIRSLARDIGEELGVGAYMSALKRASIGEYQLSDARGVEGLVSAD